MLRNHSGSKRGPHVLMFRITSGFPMVEVVISIGVGVVIVRRHSVSSGCGSRSTSGPTQATGQGPDLFRHPVWGATRPPRCVVAVPLHSLRGLS